MSEQEILVNIKNELIFGVAEVDIRVPDHLKEYFQEMPPVFKNTTVNYADIGEYMKEYLEESQQTFKERRYLIGSMYGEKQLFVTPLLRWYMEMGLEITKVYQVIEFSPRKCFRGFMRQVSDDRRSGDRDPAFKAVADTSKLIGRYFQHVYYLIKI